MPTIGIENSMTTAASPVMSPINCSFDFAGGRLSDRSGYRYGGGGKEVPCARARSSRSGSSRFPNPTGGDARRSIDGVGLLGDVRRNPHKLHQFLFNKSL